MPRTVGAKDTVVNIPILKGIALKGWTTNEEAHLAALIASIFTGIGQKRGAGTGSPSYLFPQSGEALDERWVRVV